DAIDFPAGHPLYAGTLAPANAAVRGALASHDVILIVGGRAFMPYPFTPVEAVPPGARIVQIDADPAEVGRNYPVTLGLVGAVRPTLAALAHRLAGRVATAEPRLAEARERKAEAEKDFDRMATSRYGAAPI